MIGDVMARAFEVFAKDFYRNVGLAAWKVAASYDRSIVREDRDGASTDAAGRRYRGSVESLRRSMVKSFSAGRRYASVQELIIDRTARGSAISEALRRDAERTNEALSERDRLSTGWGDEDEKSPWELSGLRFCFDSDFRGAFQKALAEDGFSDDARSLWSGVDRIARSLGDSDAVVDDDLEARQVDELMRCEREVVVSLVLASLFGPNDYAQFLGYRADSTPALQEEGEEAGQISAGAVLRPVIPVGPESWDYVAVEQPGIRIPQGGKARIGREGPWCVGDESVGIVSPSKWASKRHCEIFQRDGEWRLRDMGSTNKTLVVRPSGGRFVLSGEETELGLGCIICVAPCRVVSEYGEDLFEWRFGSEGECYRFEIR